MKVFKERNDTELLYGGIENSDLNKKVPCPDPVSYTCEIMNGTITWYKVWPPEITVTLGVNGSDVFQVLICKPGN